MAPVAERARDGDESGPAADADDADVTDADVPDADEAGPGTARRSGRPSKWDRPRAPRDWRFVVGGTGRVLLSTGLLMFAFVAYQLWGTGIETARSQRSLEDRFEELVATGEATPTTAGAPATEPPTTPAPITTPESVPPSVPESTEPPTTVPPTTTTPPPPPPPPPIVRRGEVLAKLEIPRIDQELYVVPGVGPDDLKQGPGHYPDSPLPGQLGNAAIAGHRTTYGAPFFDIDQLEPGDELRVTMTNGERFVYDVTGVEIVEATDYWVVTTQRPDVAELTLTSCHPKYSASQRIVVHSVLDESQSSPVGPPTFYDLDADPGDTPPGDDPALRADTTDPTPDTTAPATERSTASSCPWRRYR